MWRLRQNQTQQQEITNFLALGERHTRFLSLPSSLLIPASAFVCIFLRASLCISSKLVNYGLVSWCLNVIDQMMERQGKGDPLVQMGRSSLETQWILGSSGRLCA
ncbi:hypothetical protein ILYODFUR_016986 [Ilyodon furcidens]|uniref:Uncharacterized protein n=1 Tax=Ilyodon furcidens TaxID=33524 RepID=A0ABV0UJU9_9TELE